VTARLRSTKNLPASVGAGRFHLRSAAELGTPQI
jgi:hypothetical protein